MIASISRKPSTVVSPTPQVLSRPDSVLGNLSVDGGAGGALPGDGFLVSSLWNSSIFSSNRMS